MPDEVEAVIRNASHNARTQTGNYSFEDHVDAVYREQLRHNNHHKSAHTAPVFHLCSAVHKAAWSSYANIMQWMQQAVSKLVGEYSSGPLQQKGVLSKVQRSVRCTFACRHAGLTGTVCLVQEQLTTFFTASTDLLETAGESDTCWRL